MSDYVHLHCHSYYSLMDGLNSPLELCEAAKDVGQTAIAITDHGTLAAHRELQEAAVATGIKPVLGLEAYLSPTTLDDRRPVSKREDNTQLYNHLVILAKNAAGYKNLSELSTAAWRDGFYYKPRIDFDLLSQYSEGLIVLSGCLNGVIAKAIANNEPQLAVDWTNRFKDLFGDDFYMEIQGHNPKKVNDGLISLADGMGVPLVATSDCHYARAEDRDLEEVMLTLSTSPKINKEATYEASRKIEGVAERLDYLYEERPMSFQEWDLYVNTRGDVSTLLEQQGHNRPDAFENTVAIADSIGDYDYHEQRDFLPEFTTEPFDKLRANCLEGLRALGADGPEYLERLESELKVIDKMDFSNYFLIVDDIVKFAEREGIRVGPGRGSAAGSLICYALGITKIDPLKYNLLFARFINEERNDYPDIDLDFQHNRRGEIKEYIREKYGHVASIATYTYFRGKGIVRDIARVFRIPLGQVESALKNVETWEDFCESPTTAEFRDKYPEIVAYGERLRDKIRSTGVHPAGVVVANEPLEQFAPIEYRTEPGTDKKVPVIAMDMDVAANLGLIKFDILGLKDLTVIDDAIAMIDGGCDIDSIPLDDDTVLGDIADGQTVGVFQCDTGPYRGLIKSMNIGSFEDLYASNALVRPGAMNTIGEEFIERQSGKKRVQYVHEDMREYLEDSYGVIVYQEQVMLAAVVLGGFSWSEADKLRKIIGKKKDVSEFDQYRDKFVTNASQKVPEGVAKQLWEDFQAHAAYSFNKSHAVAYSLVSYQTAWLKTHYPKQYMCAALRHVEKKDAATPLLMESKRLGIPFLLPHVNKSGPEFSIEGESIRFGLTSVKYISEKVYGNIAKHRPYKSYADFIEKATAKKSGINKRAVESLDLVGGIRFADHGYRGDEGDYMYDVLGVPKFSELSEFPEELRVNLTPLNEYDETMTCFVSGMVSDLRVDKRWSLVTFLDESGTGAAFHGPDTPAEKGAFYIALLADKRIQKMVPLKKFVDAYGSGLEDGVVRYLRGDSIGSADEPLVVYSSKRQTKAGRMMGTIIVDRGDGLESLLLFPNDFGKLFNKLRSGQRYKIQTARTRDGSEFITGVE